MLSLFREISLRHWMRAPLRAALVILGIALGVALYVATGAASESMFAAFDEFTKRVSTRADLSITSTGEGVSNGLIGPLSEVPGVAHVAASVEFSTQAPDLHESVMILGVDLLGDLHFLPYETRSEDGQQGQIVDDPLAFINEPRALLVTEGFAEQHHLEKDGTLRLLTAEGPKEFVVRGLLANAGPGAAFGEQVAIMFMDAAQVSFAKGQLADRIDVAVEPDADPMQVRAALLKELGPGYMVEPPERMGAQLRELGAPLRNSLWLSGLLALIVGGFLVYNAVGVAVAQRRREIGMLRTFGVTRSATTLLFAGEAALLAVPGVALGLGLGQSLSRVSAEQTLGAIDRLYMAIPRGPDGLSGDLVLQGVCAGIFTAAMAGFFPARRGARTPPALVLRGETATVPPVLARWWLLGTGVVVSACAFLPILRASGVGSGVAVMALVVGPALATPALILAFRRALLWPVTRWGSVPARLGMDYVTRALGRSTINVLALMMAVGLSVAVGGWLTSFERTIVGWADQVGLANLTVTQGSPLVDRHHVPFSGEPFGGVADIPGVRATQRFRILNQVVAGQPVKMVATDLEVFRREAERLGKGWTLLAGEPLQARELSEQPQALISGNAADRLGLKVGDTFELPGQLKPMQFTVRAVILDYTSEVGAIFIDRRFYLEGWGDQVVDSLFVYLEPNTDEAAVAAQIKAQLGGDESIFVTNSASVRQQLIDTLHSTFSYSKSVEMVTLVIALMGIVGTMAAAIIDRTRELAMLRAVGATPRQVATALVVEAGFLGMCAAVIGVATGSLQCQLFLQTFLTAETGFHLNFAFPWAASLRIGGLVTITSAAAGGIAALRAGRDEVAFALRSNA